MIRNNIYAIHLNKEYQIRHSDGIYELVSYDKADTENGFVLDDALEMKTVTGRIVKLPPKDKETPDIYLKKVSKGDVEEVYWIDTYGVYKKHEFDILQETDTQYELSSGGFGVKELEFEMIDRGNYHKWVDKAEVDPVYERKTPKPNFFR